MPLDHPDHTPDYRIDVKHEHEDEVVAVYLGIRTILRHLLTTPRTMIKQETLASFLHSYHSKLGNLGTGVSPWTERMARNSLKHLEETVRRLSSSERSWDEIQQTLDIEHTDLSYGVAPLSKEQIPHISACSPADILRVVRLFEAVNPFMSLGRITVEGPFTDDYATIGTYIYHHLLEEFVVHAMGGIMCSDEPKKRYTHLTVSAKPRESWLVTTLRFPAVTLASLAAYHEKRWAALREILEDVRVEIEHSRLNYADGTGTSILSFRMPLVPLRAIPEATDGDHPSYPPR